MPTDRAYREIGRRIREARDALGISQEAVAEHLEVSGATYSRYESGKVRIPTSELAKVARFLGVPVEYLLSGSGDPPRARTPEEILSELQESLRRQRDEEQRRLGEQLEGSGEGPILVEVLRQPVSAGAGALDTELPPIPFWPIPGERSHVYKAVEVIGDCLEPRVMAGHFVIVDLDETPKPGDLVAAQHDGEYLVKILEARDGLLFLVALQNREPVQVDDRYTRLIGVVKGAYYRP